MSAETFTLLGATGYTGRLIAAEAVRRGVPLRLAGRRRDALRDLAEELGGDVEIAVADVHDRRALERLAAAAGVLVTTVGPYARLGQPVLDACVAAGADYLDVSGEINFLGWAHAQDERAAAAGSVVCPGFGFDGVPGDLLAGLAAQRLAGDAGTAIAEARAAYLVRHGRVSAGTARSTLGIAAEGGAAWLHGEVVAEPVAAHHWRVPFPAPLGPRHGTSFPAPEVVTLGRTTGAGVARAYAVNPLAPLGPALARPLRQLTRAAAATPVWTLLERVVDRLPEGPEPAQRAATRTAVLAEVRDADGRAIRGWSRIRDLYGATAVIAVEVALRLAAGGAAPAGTHTPFGALGVDGARALLDRLGPWELFGASPEQVDE